VPHNPAHQHRSDQMHQENLKILFLPFFAFFTKKAKKEEKGMSFTCQTTFLMSPKSNFNK
jgi:hypothetical protein